MKMYRAFGSVELGKQLATEKHSIMEGVINIHINLKHQDKTHRSVCDRNIGNANAIPKSIPLNIDSKSRVMRITMILDISRVN